MIEAVRRGQLKVLIVDDNSRYRELMVRRLERKGMETLQADDGATAISLLMSMDEALPDAILMDYFMPIFKGDLATRIIRKLEPIQSIPILIISAVELGSEEEGVEKQASLDAGANYFCHKHLKFDQMYEKLVQVSGMRPSA